MNVRHAKHHERKTEELQSAVAPQLGRPLAGNPANVTVHVLEPYAQLGERINEVDVRLRRYSGSADRG